MADDLHAPRHCLYNAAEIALTSPEFPFLLHNMSGPSQFTAKWRKLLGLSTTNTAIRDGLQDSQVSRAAQSGEKTSQHPKEPVDNAKTSPLLRLPAELRFQIYSYLDLSEYIIEVKCLSKSQFNALDVNGVPCRHNPYPEEQVWYRLQETSDEEFSLDKPNIDTRRKRCISVLGLFALPRVCRQIRTDTLLLHFKGPSFAFSDQKFNYAKAFPAFVRSLSSREKAAIRSIYWPLRQAREFYASSQADKPVELPDRAFIKEFRTLPLLRYVVLRYVATDVGARRLTGSDLAELRILVRGVEEGERWQTERVFRRELHMRGMRKQLSDREDVAIECVRTQRVAF